MFDTLQYLYQTIKQQIVDEVTIFHEISHFYAGQIKENINFKKKIKQIDKKLKYARNYEEWSNIAKEHDQLPQIQEALNNVYSPYYDYEYIAQLTNQLKKARSERQMQKLVSILRSHNSRNIGNLTSSVLYRDAYNSTKKSIQDFQQEIAKCLKVITQCDIPNIKKLQFFGQLRHAVGRSALLLSGGAILGMHHIGVAQALIQADCMPNIIAGSSAGSIIASLIATRKKQDFFDGSKFNFLAFANKKKLTLWKKFKRVAKTGYFMDNNVLKAFLKDNLGEITFQQAFDTYGYILNITVTSSNQYDEDRLLNYLTAPNVMIWSAVAASCAIPFVYGAIDLCCKDTDGQIKPYTLMNRKFVDGSLGGDLPMNKLSIFFNVNNFIVSQTNPWVIPFMDHSDELRATSNIILIKIFMFLQRLKNFIISQMKHRVGQMSLIFTGSVTKIFNLATQQYQGNITIWPLPSVSNYLRIMQNPTSFNNIMNFVEDGRFRTYPKISQIKSSLFYQKQIAKCFRAIRNQTFLSENQVNRLQKQSVRELSQFCEDEYFQNLNKKNQKQIHFIKARNQSFIIPRMKSFAQ